jgi:hypothetical protein
METVNLDSLGLVREEVERQLLAKRRNQEWLAAHREDLRGAYPDKYVAVFDGEIAAVDEDLDGLFKQLRSKLKETDLSTVAVDLIISEDVIWIL